MSEYLPLLIAGAVIGVVTTIFLIVYALEKNKKEKVFGFIKKYGYYITAFVLVMGITMAVVLNGGVVNDVDSPPVDTPTDTKPIVFSLPLNSPDVVKWYSDTDLMYNETLKQWESHKAVDLVSENLDVYSVLAGVVTDVQNSYEYGTVITITHDNGFVSKYSSLNETTEVTISDRVTAGQKIGTISQSAADEVLAGAHLHFELFKDGQKVDPANYLTLENK